MSVYSPWSSSSFHGPGATAWAPWAPNNDQSGNDTPTHAPPSYEYYDSDPQTHQTLQRFTKLADEDVEMQPPLAESSAYLVIDTNILLHHFDMLVAFTEDVERLNLPLVIIIPFTVINELDWQKKSNWFSRRASVWLWNKAQEKKVLKGQAKYEILSNDKRYSNDDKIIDCAAFFSRRLRTFLCSADTNMCFQAQGEGTIAVINPNDYKHWSCQILGPFIFSNVEPSRFSSWSNTYTAKSNLTTEDTRTDDSMDVDLEQDDITLSDARTSLHRQIIETFIGLMTELVASDQQASSLSKSGEGASASMHAPSVSASMHAIKREKRTADMNTDEILEYIEDGPMGSLELRRDNPTLNCFLARPYTPHSGWRKGNSWSTKDWLLALKKLQRIGESWKKSKDAQTRQAAENIITTLQYDLLPHLRTVFSDSSLTI